MYTADAFGLRLDSSWMPWQTSVAVSKRKRRCVCNQRTGVFG